MKKPAAVGGCCYYLDALALEENGVRAVARGTDFARAHPNIVISVRHGWVRGIAPMYNIIRIPI